MKWLVGKINTCTIIEFKEIFFTKTKMKGSLRKRNRRPAIYDSDSDNSTDPEPLLKKRKSSKKKQKMKSEDFSADEYEAEDLQKPAKIKHRDSASSKSAKRKKVEFVQKDEQEMDLAEIIDAPDFKERKKRKTKLEYQQIKKEKEEAKAK